MNMKCCLIVCALFLLYGCAGIMNPYKGSFKCPETEEGKCVSVDTAYEESISDKEDKKAKGAAESIKSLQDELRDNRKKEKHTSEDSDYEKALLGRMKGLLSDPVTPMVATPQAYRVLFLTYPGGDELFMPRYVYFMMDKPRWILDNYLNSKVPGGE